jgi:hypothetical protein
MAPALINRNTPHHAELEQYFTPKELGEILKVHEKTVKRMFQDEPGVLKLNQKRLLRGRPHVTLRIPRSVFERVARKMAL